MSNDSLVKLARKHSDAPFAVGKIAEHFQFGLRMFDLSDLKGRYARSVTWDGWGDYWTETLPRNEGGGELQKSGVVV